MVPSVSIMLKLSQTVEVYISKPQNIPVTTHDNYPYIPAKIGIRFYEFKYGFCCSIRMNHMMRIALADDPSLSRTA